jgi:hypothetical protein
MNSEHTGRAPRARSAPVPSVPAGSLEPFYAGLARLAAGVCGLPYASISLTDCGAVWYRANEALPVAAVPPTDAFFGHVARAGGLFEVEDTALDERFRGAAWAAGATALRFYAGCALRNGDGEMLGVLAVYSTGAHRLSFEQRSSLLLLAQQGVVHAEMRARLAELELLTPAQPGDSVLARALVDSAPVAIYHTRGTSANPYVNPEYRRVFNLGPQQSSDDWALAVHPDDRARLEETWADFCRPPAPDAFRVSHPVRRRHRALLLRTGGRRRRCSRLRRHHQRFHRSGDHARQFAQNRNLVPQHLRPGADRHRVR